MGVEGGLEGEWGWEREDMHCSGTGGDGVVVGPSEEVGWRIGGVLVSVVRGVVVVVVGVVLLEVVTAVLQRRGFFLHAESNDHAVGFDVEAHGGNG